MASRPTLSSRWQTADDPDPKPSVSASSAGGYNLRTAPHRMCTGLPQSARCGSKVPVCRLKPRLGRPAEPAALPSISSASSSASVSQTSLQQREQEEPAEQSPPQQQQDEQEPEAVLQLDAFPFLRFNNPAQAADQSVLGSVMQQQQSQLLGCAIIGSGSSEPAAVDKRIPTSVNLEERMQLYLESRRVVGYGWQLVLLEQLGRGGCDSVWLAMVMAAGLLDCMLTSSREAADAAADPNSGYTPETAAACASHIHRRVAVKFPFKEEEIGLPEEAAVMQQLHHAAPELFPGMYDQVAIRMPGTDLDSQPGIMMQYFKDGDLQVSLNQLAAMGVKTLPAEMVRNIAQQAAEALEAMHDRGVIHRDLKPANLLLESRELMQVVLAGFGKCKQLISAWDKGCTAVGTHPYWAPDVRENNDEGRNPSYYTFEADTYSLGMLVVALRFPGEVPFEYIDLLEELSKSEKAARMADKAAELYRQDCPYTKGDCSLLPMEVEFLAWCLQNDPRHRPTVGVLRRQHGYLMPDGPPLQGE